MRIRRRHAAEQASPPASPGEGQWLRTVVNEPTDTLALPALGIHLSVAELYANATFPDADAPMPTG